MMMKLELKITKKEIEVAIVLSVFALMVVLAVKSILFFESQYEESLLAEENRARQIVQSDPFADLFLTAKAFYVWDTRAEKAIAFFNEETQFPLASLTKLMTVLVASEISPNGIIITIDQPDLDGEGDNGLRVGEKWRLADIIDFVLMSSSNDGARALASVANAFAGGENAESGDDNDKDAQARSLFVKEMNKKAKKLGLAQTFYLNESGLDITEALSGAYGSAKDTAILLENILREYPYLLEVSARAKTRLDSDILSHSVDNTNQMINIFPNVVASKTGWTDLAGGNLVIAFDMGIGHTIIISILGSTKEDRFSDMEQLIWASIEQASSSKY